MLGVNVDTSEGHSRQGITRSSIPVFLVIAYILDIMADKVTRMVTLLLFFFLLIFFRACLGWQASRPEP